MDAEFIHSQKFKNDQYQSAFVDQLKGFYESQTLTDVTLSCASDKETIHCHKLVLAGLSPYFRAMFTSNFVETHSNHVVIPAADLKTLKLVIDYAYSGSLVLTLKNVQAVFSLASLLQLEDILTACSHFMYTHLDLNNALNVFHFAKVHQADELTKNSRHFIIKNIIDIVNDTPDFVEFEHIDVIIEILSDDELNVSSELFVLEAILKWIEHDLENRETKFESLFISCIRLQLLDTKSLSSFYKSRFHLISSKCMQLIEERLDSQDSQPQGNIRSGMNKPEYCFLVVGGNCEVDDGYYVNCINPYNGKKYLVSRSFQEKSLERGYFHVENPGVCVTTKDRVFVGGGNWVYHEYKLFNSKDKYFNKLQKHGTRSANSSEKMRCFDEDLKADCYTDGDEKLSKEFFEYDKLRDTWTKKANMLFAKANFSLCVMNDRIYSFGGITNDQEQLDIVEYYDINENKWTYVGSMPHKFIAGCVISYEDCFFVMGGRSGVGRFNNCYKFKPETNDWQEISGMRVGRFNFGACVRDKKIYIFGGQRYNESDSYYTRESLDSVEVYDIESDQWTMCEPMPSSLYNTAVCAYDTDCLYLCGTTECKFSGNTIIGFMFTSIFRLEFKDNTLDGKGIKWTIVEHEVTDIKSNYRSVATRLNLSKLYKMESSF